MGDMVGSIAGSAVDVLLQNLISLCGEEISLIRNFKKDLGNLKASLDTIQSFLNDAEEKQVTNEAVRGWLKKLEVVAFDADNVLDELSYEVLRNKIETETGNNIKKKVLKCFWRRKMGRKIRNINENLKSINEEATGFGLQSQLRAYAPNFVSDSSRETDSYSVDPIVEGREDYVSRIVEILTSNNSTHDEQEVFSVLPIDGMGGLGKTTIAKLVFQDEKIKGHFNEFIWVYVSENFDAKDLFKKILESLTGQKVDIESKDVILRNIREKLQDKKYLLVLDDVWTEETKKWGDFRETLSSISSVNGNGIIVTTRSKGVASVVGTICNIPELSKLSDEECWSIIKRKAFRRRSEILSEFETIGRKIAERCHGLPLVANVLGGLLYGKPKEEWQSIEATRLSDLGEDGNSVMKILKLSFHNLPLQLLKKCFAFCSIFPKGYEIEKDMLIYLWMAEGFLQSDGGNDMETVGQKYFDLLLQNSLLQIASQDLDGNILKCKMHDLVHDLATLVSHKSGRVRFMYMNSDTEISKEAAANLRSIIFEGKFSEKMSADLKCLRGLVLIGGDNKELPEMEHLKHLRYLDISKTRVEYSPRSIGNLYHLQTLRASNDLNEIPKTLKNLRNLRHLHILATRSRRNHVSNIEELPMLGHLPHLKSIYLDYLPKVRFIGASSDGIHEEGGGKDKIIVFPALKRLLLSSVSSMTGLLAVDESQLDREVVAFPYLESLQLYWPNELSSGPSNFPCLKELNISLMSNSVFLENLLLNLTSPTRIELYNLLGLVCLPDMFLSNNQNLSYLKIGRCHDLKHLPPLFGSSLREIEIWDCKNFEELPNNLHCLNSLKKLHIWGCPNLKSIPYNPSGEGHEPVQGFTSLRELIIGTCPSLSELPSGMIELCTSLETLKISGCRNLKSIPYNTSGKGDEPLQGFTLLRKLIIMGCDSLTELPSGMIELCTSLETLKISRCRNLKSIPYNPSGEGHEPVQGFTWLRELEISRCDSLTELPSGMIELCTSLETVKLWELPNVTNLVEVVGCLQKMPHPTKLVLDLRCIPELDNNNFPIELGSLRNLRLLSISCGMKNWESVQDQIQHLTNLRRLVLCELEIETLPEWLGRLSSLRGLSLLRCPKLRSLPSKEAMKRLKKLEIERCPLLNVRSDDDNSEWHKIKNISRVSLV